MGRAAVARDQLHGRGLEECQSAGWSLFGEEGGRRCFPPRRPSKSKAVQPGGCDDPVTTAEQ